MAIKQIEMKIGDWVELTDPINKGERVKVKQIHKDGFIIFEGGITKNFKLILFTEDINNEDHYFKAA